jgi:hypothetical protein
VASLETFGYTLAMWKYKFIIVVVVVVVVDKRLICNCATVQNPISFCRLH